MSDISKEKERREELALKLRSANSVSVRDTRIKAEDLQGLLDMADERDRYREMLGRCREIAYGIADEIEAVLEGKHD